MNRFLTTLNLLGVLALAGLCGLQWQANSALHRQTADMESVHLKQEAQLEKQTQTIAGQAADLEDFRTRLTKTNDDLKTASASLADAKAQVASKQDELKALGLERDGLAAKVKAMDGEQALLAKQLTDWSTAVDARDAVIAKQNALVTALGKARNDAIAQSNAVTEKFNALAGDREEAVKKFNDLVAKYNDLVAQVNEAQKKDKK